MATDSGAGSCERNTDYEWQCASRRVCDFDDDANSSCFILCIGERCACLRPTRPNVFYGLRDPPMTPGRGHIPLYSLDALCVTRASPSAERRYAQTRLGAGGGIGRPVGARFIAPSGAHRAPLQGKRTGDEPTCRPSGAPVGFRWTRRSCGAGRAGYNWGWSPRSQRATLVTCSRVLVPFDEAQDMLRQAQHERIYSGAPASYENA